LDLEVPKISSYARNLYCDNPVSVDLWENLIGSLTRDFFV